MRGQPPGAPRVGIDLDIVVCKSKQTEFLRQGRHRGLEMEIAIRDVRGEHAVGPQLRLIELHGLTREEMGRNAVGAEGVENDQVLRSVSRPAQRQTAIANHDVDPAGRVLEVGE